MQPHAMSFLALSLSCVAAGSVSAFMMGPDNRVPADVPHHAMAGVDQVGIVRVDGADFGTGLLLGANCDVVISAGHVALPEPGTGPAQRFSFELAPGSGVPGIAAILVDSGLIAPEHRDDDAQDWAIFRLERSPAGACAQITFGPAPDDCAGPIVMAGFHFDRPDVRLIEHACAAHGSTAQGLLIHDCDTKEGSSGAPLYCAAGGRLELIALNTSGVARRSYYDPGVYGKEGARFDRSRHRNHAVPLRGQFLHALQAELAQSAARASGKKRTGS